MPARILLALACSTLVLCAGTAVAATIVVTNLNDSGPGSLRAAIEAAPGTPTTITFHASLAGGTIVLASPLPGLAPNTAIDGDLGGDCDPDIALDGSAVNEHGLRIHSPGCTVRGLAIGGFALCGVFVANLSDPATGNAIECSYLGLALDGVTGWPLGSGVCLANNAGNSRVGPGNLIANNGGAGISIWEGFVEGAYPEFSGLTPDATVRFPVIDFPDTTGPFASADGIVPTDGGGHTFGDHFGMRLTGTVTVGEAGDYAFAITQIDDWARLVVDGVTLLDLGCCTGATATVPLTEGDHPVELDFFEAGGAARVTLEITGPGTATLSSGGQPGLLGELFQLRIPVEGVTITGNSIFGNDDRGIVLESGTGPVNDVGDADLGPNGCLNSPEFEDATPLGGRSFQLSGTAAANAAIEVFASAGDPSGYGEGKTLLATVTAGPTGDFMATVSLPQGSYAVTATATDGDGNTSEFSRNHGLVTHYLTVTSSDDSGPGTLRDALEQSIADGTDTVISFDPPLAGATIGLESPLPAISDDGTIIDGDIDADCWPDIELDGSLVDDTGLRVQSSDNIVRGLVINRFANDGILIRSRDGSTCTGNTVACCFLGTDATGTSALPNGRSNPYSAGVTIDSCAGNTVGGARATARNLLSGNLNGGVNVRGPGATGNLIAGNLIGTDVSGTFAIPNSYSGIDFQNSDGNTVGGVRATHGNLVSGNQIGMGIGGNGNTIAGNFVGTDTTGTTAIPNAVDGITVHGTDNLIGGDAATMGNLVSGNLSRGVIFYDGGDANRVEGNLLGTDITGTAALGNGWNGVAIYGGAGNVVGSTDPARRNVISGNDGPGVSLWNDDAVGNQIIGNWIGIGADGTTPVGNGAGVSIWLQAGATVVGGPGGAANWIAYNDTQGVSVFFQGGPEPVFGYGNRISRNSIHDNGGLGIDLGDGGPDSNDPGDGDDGPNRLVNAPVIASAVTACGSGATTVMGAVDTFNPDLGLVELFGSPAADPSGFGEGQTFLAQTVPAFNGAFTYVVPVQPVGSVITATFTDADGNTSEFSNAAIVQTTPLAPSGLQAEAAPGPAVDLSWLDNAADETGLRIERRAAGDLAFSLLATVAANTTAYHDASDLVGGTTYYYRVRADGACTSAWSNVASALVPGAAPTFCRTTLTTHRSAIYPVLDAGNGGFGALWRDCEGGLCAIAYAKLDASGAATTGPTVISTRGEISLPRIVAGAGVAAGEWGVSWWQHLADQWGVFFARLDDDGEFLGPRIRVNQGNDLYPWRDGRGHGLAWDGTGWGMVWPESTGGLRSIRFARISPLGIKQLGDVIVSDSPNTLVYPALAFDGTHYGVVWVDRGYSPPQLYFRRFATNGIAAGPSVQVAVGSNHDGNTVDLVWNGTEYGLAWIDRRDGDRAVYFQRLDATGAPLSAAARLSDPREPGLLDVYAWYPVLRWLGDRWVVATTASHTGMETNEVVLAFADAAGARLGSDVVLSTPADGVFSEAPGLAWDGGSLLTAWHDYAGSMEIRAQATDSTGDAGANPRRVLTSGHIPGGAGLTSPSVVATGDGYVAAWQDLRRGGGWYDVYLRRLDASGTPVGEEVLVSGAAAAEGYISSSLPLAFSGEVVAVMWYDGIANEMMLARFDSGLNRLGADIVLSDSPIWNASMVWTGEAFLAAWVDTRDGNQEIYVAAIAPDGSVLQPGARISAAPGVSQLPAISGDGRGRAVAWRDQRDGNQEIYTAALDPLGRRTGPERRITSDPAAQSWPQLAWNGSHHLLVWQDASTTPNQGHGIRLGADAAPVGGVFRIDTEEAMAPTVAWGGSSWAATFLGKGGRYREVDPDGNLLGTERRIFATPSTFSAVTLAWDGSGFVFGETSGGWLDQEPWVGTLACALDDTAPSCPSALDLSLIGDDAVLSWEPGSDLDGGVLWQAVYRDGVRVAVLEPEVGLFADLVAPLEEHTYRVTTLNHAMLEAPGCPEVVLDDSVWNVPLFADDFETGTTAAWSDTVP